MVVIGYGPSVPASILEVQAKYDQPVLVRATQGHIVVAWSNSELRRSVDKAPPISTCVTIESRAAAEINCSPTQVLHTNKNAKGCS